MENLGYDVSFNLRRLWRLIRREGIRAAFRKGWPYLTRRITDEFRLRDLARTGSVEERFTKIYKWNFWRAAESRSGPGSSLNDTETLRQQLPLLFKQFNIKSVVDAPCGDFRWMQLVVAKTDITYTGGDIVRPMIEKNQATFGSDRARFVHLDITAGPLPKADLWVCRDCFYHLSINDIFAALNRFVESETPYLLVSHARAASAPHNYDIVSGDHRLVVLYDEPFCFPRDVLFQIDDFDVEEKALRESCLWSREQVMRVLEVRKTEVEPRAT